MSGKKTDNRSDSMATIRKIAGGVCAPSGFRASGTACGIKGTADKKDLALIASDAMCSAAAVYTTNKVKGAPLIVTKKNISDGRAIAVICNSGNANTCAPNGIELAERTCELTAAAIGAKSSDIVVCSTGVIGQELYIEPFEKGIPVLAAELDREGSASAAEAIMTTDTIPKELAVEFEIEGVTCRIGGIAKGSGMINPNMATMLSFITTDVDIDPELLDETLREDVKTSYNQICVDGDTSTNDMTVILANGTAENRRIEGEGEALEIFREALSQVTVYLSKKLAADGEGATKLIECRVTGAEDDEQARIISKSVIASDLLKAAMFGADANWGRVLCAIGYAPGNFSTDNIDVEMMSERGSVIVCRGSRHEEYSETKASEILGEKEIIISVDMHQGSGSAVAWGCDLTYDYVKINGDYRS